MPLPANLYWRIKKVNHDEDRLAKRKNGRNIGNPKLWTSRIGVSIRVLVKKHKLDRVFTEASQHTRFSNELENYACRSFNRFQHLTGFNKLINYRAIRKLCHFFISLIVLWNFFSFSQKNYINYDKMIFLKELNMIKWFCLNYFRKIAVKLYTLKIVKTC